MKVKLVFIDKSSKTIDCYDYDVDTNLIELYKGNEKENKIFMIIPLVNLKYFEVLE